MKSITLPNEEEFLLLKSISAKNDRIKIRLRAKIILLRLKAFSYRKIANLLHCCRETIINCIDSWNKSKIGGILKWRRTSTWKKQANRRSALDHLISHKPDRIGLPFTSWSLRTLKAFFINWLGNKISISTIRRDLKLLNYHHNEIEQKIVFKPANYDVRRAQLSFLKQFKPPSSRLVYVDEKGPMSVIRYSGKVWTMKTIQQEKRQKGLGKVMFTGMFDPDDYKLLMRHMPDLNSKGFCHAMGSLIQEFLVPPYDRLIIVMDNAPIHKSKFTIEFLNNYENIDVFFLPTYSPELNPIELCFHSYQRELVSNSNFYSGVDLIRKTHNYLRYFNMERREIMKI